MYLPYVEGVYVDGSVCVSCLEGGIYMCAFVLHGECVENAWVFYGKKHPSYLGQDMDYGVSYLRVVPEWYVHMCVHHTTTM